MPKHRSNLSASMTHRQTSTATRLLGVLSGLTLALLMATSTGASANDHLVDRGIAQTCTAYAQDLERFPDVAPDGAHAATIDCLAHREIVLGRDDGTYGPDEPVTRAAMASFIARAQDYLAVRGYLPVAFEIDVEASADPAPANLNQRVAGQVNDQFDLGYFSAEVRFEVYRDDQLVLDASRTSGLGGGVEFRYNSDADEGDTDRVVSCIVDADERASDGVPFCLGGDDLEPVDGRRVTELTFDWGELAVASAAPAEGEFFGMALSIDTEDNVLGYQTLPTPDAPVDVPLGEFLVFDYLDEANFQVNGQTNVATAVFEWAVQASIVDERNAHLLNISLGPDDRNTYDLSTGTDVSGCF